MEHFGWNCLKTVTIGLLSMELSEGSAEWRVVDGTA